MKRYAQWRLERVRRSLVDSVNVLERRQYLVRDARRRPGVARYTLREGGLGVVLRHDSDDTGIFGEIFTDGYYELPARAASDLRLRGSSARIVDLGANVGLFGVWMATRFPQAQITAFEPDPANLERLHQVIAINDLAARWTVIDACASNYDGSTGFAATGTSVSSMTGPGDEQSNMQARVVDVFAHLHDADVVKIDIEGGEWAILLDARWSEVPAGVVLMEYHPRMCPQEDARGLAVQTLEQAGYRVDSVIHHDAGHGMLRAVRP